MEAGLIDGVAYWSDLKARLKGDRDDFESVSQADYAKYEPKDVGLGGKKKIAVVHAYGMIGGRESRIDPGLGMIMGHETVTAQLRKAAEDDDVAAIVFRVDSNGGESLASDIIGHEVARIAETKPVIVSMIDVAASGGYSISYRATKMVADPMTITGSIGSITGKFNMRGMWNKLGVTFDSVEKGPNALLNSGVDDYTPEQREMVEANHWDGVNRWMADIAEHRGMSFEKLESLAHGRVWTGRQAKENGLIDEVGGLTRAVELAKEEAGVSADEAVTLDHYPKQRGLVAMITGGDSPTSIASWLVYRFIHRDLAATIDLLTGGHLAVGPGAPLD
jgi:protease-4